MAHHLYLLIICYYNYSHMSISFYSNLITLFDKTKLFNYNKIAL